MVTIRGTTRTNWISRRVISLKLGILQIIRGNVRYTPDNTW